MIDMSGIKSKIAQGYVVLKTIRSIRKLNKKGLQFPRPAKEIKNVLVLLPVDPEYVDAAMTLVRHLRQHFQEWHFLVLDINKLSEDQKDRFDLPDEKFVEELVKKDFHLVIDLNLEPDLRLKYIIGLLKVLYRLGLGKSDSDYYNMYVNVQTEPFHGFGHVLNTLKSSFVD